MNLLLVNHFYPVIPKSTSLKKENDELLYTVARYGPRTSCQRKWSKENRHESDLNESFFPFRKSFDQKLKFTYNLSIVITVSRVWRLSEPRRQTFSISARKTRTARRLSRWLSRGIIDNSLEENTRCRLGNNAARCVGPVNRFIYWF